MILSIWDDFMKSVSHKKEENPIVYSVLRQLQPTELTEDRLVLSCANQGVKFFLQKKVPEIERHLAAFFKKKVSIELVVAPKKKREDPPLLKFQPTIDDIFKKAGLNGRYSFDNFAVSPTNQVAYAASSAVADKLGKAYNPLFLYGGVGVGKTHLAQAVARIALEKNPAKKIFFCPGDLFTNELVESIREKSTQKFRRKYRHLDLLIIDDVQFIEGKKYVQEEFFHTFNTIGSAGGQIILTADRPPSAIKNLEDRLKSRFSGGLTVDIQSPDFELRCAIVLIKAKEKNISIDIEAAKIIAEQVSDSRALEGTLLSLYAKTLGNDGQIDLETIENFFKRETKRRVEKTTPGDIIKAVCTFYDLKPTHLKSPQRADSIALPRQVAMFLLRNDLNMKLEDVAYQLRRKDHTTIMYGVGKVTKMMADDEVFASQIAKIRNLILISTGYSQ